MNGIKLYGAAYSVYVRIVRLALEEIGVPYELIEVDIFAKDGPPADYGARHPFGRIPAFEHDGFHLFETDAIVWYIAEALGGGALIPADPRKRARMRQIMRIMDNYGYRSLIWGIYVEEMERDRAGRLAPDEVEAGRKCLAVLEDLAGVEFLAAPQLSLADLWALPMLTYLNLAPTGQTLLRAVPKLRTWLHRMQARPSVETTRFRSEQAVG